VLTGRTSARLVLNAKDMMEGGYAIPELREGSYPAKEMCEAGANAKDMMEGGYAIPELR